MNEPQGRYEQKGHWAINENPDAIRDREDIDSPSYGDQDSVTFSLFDNFTVYSLRYNTSHGDLYKFVRIYIKPSDIELFKWSENRGKYSWYLAPEQFKKTYEIYHNGELTDNEKNKIINFDVFELDRSPILKELPNVIQGRAWTESKIISFWNDLFQITSRKNDIIKFVNLIGGNPYKYQYEIKDKLYNYEQFMLGKYNDTLEFDPTAVHTLSPDKKGEALKKMGVVPKQPVPLAFKQMLQGESFKEWLSINEMQAPPLPPPPPRLYSSPKIAPVPKTISPPAQQNPVSVQNITGWKQGGWKIHLRTGTDDKVRDRAYQIVLNLVAKNKHKWGHKKLHGGEAGEKDITIYCGPRGEANSAAREISSDKELMSLLLPASGDTLLDDMELIPGTNIYGRFDINNLKTSPYEFTQYGCRGWPMLVHDVSAKNVNKMSGKNNFDMRGACDKAYNVLSKLFGKDFTG